ncbi:zf-HC2 domain-containing protein [Streptomyces sp. H27-D2]|uniref:zf-HC2 domain-containing protein n=1 Tax=Streptomyces sp. H27-D2 TaxID=3046304 RepID=UPI002DBE9C9D|nr:zf-HC2 domain-containing protein [Streptomyces sp. H27-D2]MEC4016803.1 zf-HC2 domain-containing protein [Streptomyces sp. H27-D2]
MTGANGPVDPTDPDGRDGQDEPPRIPRPRSAAEDNGPLPTPPPAPPAAEAATEATAAEDATADASDPREPATGEPDRSEPTPETPPDAPTPPNGLGIPRPRESSEGGGPHRRLPDRSAPRPAPRERPVPRERPGPPPQPQSEIQPVGYGHLVLKSLLGAWALAACSAEETAAVEAHLTDCAACADEALRLRDAVDLLHPEDSLDLDPMLRSRVLEACLGRRPARIPVPQWAAPYDAEVARLDALLRDIGESEWRAPVRLRWFEGERAVERETTVAEVIGHLMIVDGLVATALGLSDPLTTTTTAPGVPGFLAAPASASSSPAGPHAPGSPTARTEAYWRSVQRAASGGSPTAGPPSAIRAPWRDQAHTLVRTVSFAGGGTSELGVGYGGFALPLRDAFLERAFECWVHAGDIAEAVDYPYRAPSPGHLHRMVDLAARLLPSALADRRRAGLAGPPGRLVAAGAPGRTLHLEVEGSGGGHWYIALDSPGATASPEESVAHIALDSVEFCQLTAGHVSPEEAAAGQDGDRQAIRDVLFAAASMSRL